jgi:hypothetical protein
MPESHPATRLCASYAEARQLVEELAASINFKIEWTTPPVRRADGQLLTEAAAVQEPT